MARARNIKPSFFINDKLAENDPLGRLLFAGMWTIADYKGEFEWREKRIKAQLLPYDDCDVKKLAINLDKSGFIRFYSDGEKIYVNIVNFLQHQNPHKNEREKGSSIPKYREALRQLIDLQELTINRDLSGSEREHSASDPADSLNPYPDSLNPYPPSHPPKGKSAKKFTDDDMAAAEYILKLIRELNPNHKHPNLDNWADEIRLIRERDKRTHREICGLFKWANNDEFWKSNILSPAKLRQKWDQLTLKRQEKTNGTGQNQPGCGAVSRAKRIADKLDEIARRDIAERGGVTEALG